MKVFIAGQKHFGQEVFRLCIKLGFEVIGVAAPLDSEKPDRLAKIATTFEVPVIQGGTLNKDTMPKGADLGIAAHSFDYISRPVRYKAKYGWIGFHPSLLPRHRGRDAVKWAIKMGDPITGGTVYWLNSGVDKGDIAAQDWCFIRKDEDYKALWRNKLSPMGLRLFEQVLTEIKKGNFPRTPQDEAYATWEPGLNPPPVTRPDLLMLNQTNERYG